MPYMQEWRRPRQWLVASAMVLLAVALASVTPVITDEWWGNLVVDRVVDGDRLYGDVFYGTGPWGVVLALGARAVPAPDLITLRMVNLGASLTILAITDWGLFRAGRGSTVRAASVATVALLLVPAAVGQIYSAASMAFAFAAILVCVTRPSRWGLIAAGVLGAASAGVKSNVGLAAIAVVVLLTMFHSRPGERLRRTLTAAVGVAAGLIVTTVVPLLLIGDSAAFIRQAILGRRDYVGAGGLTATGPWDELLLRAYVGRPDLILADPGMLLLLGCGAVCVAGLLLLRRSAPTAVVLFAFVAVAVAMVLPRPDWMHLGVASAGLILGLVGIPATWPPGTLQRLVALAAPVTVAVCGAALLGSFVGGLRHVPASNPLVASAGGGFLRDPEADRLAPAISALQRQVRSPVFIVSGSAPRLYQLGGFVNPTRYDYPYTSNFTSSAQDAAIEAITDGRITYVCVTDQTGAWAPSAFIDYVRRNLRLVEATIACDLYTTRAPI